MVFSSYTFVFGFLPIFLLIYFAIRPGLRNAFILIASLLFYSFGDVSGLVALLGAIVLNYSVGLALGPAGDYTQSQRGRRLRKGWLTAGIVVNLAVLIWYKYIGLATSSVDAIAARLGHPDLVPVIQATLPLGISFFVFQGMSYLIDVYRGTIAPTRSIIVFGAYKSLFPQLIAGPIVRYKDIADSLQHRTVERSMVFDGIVRFVTGFAKKVLIADMFAVTADSIFALSVSEMTTATAWLGAIGYTFQIYFDFSAYSDMAIGMGMMMGFRFPENFNYPYRARSIKEFWRYWHMTLSGWFRDYVYIPLGGSRRGEGRTYLNLLIVWMLTGLWHGAAWTFVAWGLWHGGFIMLERRIGIERLRIPSVVRWGTTMLIIVVGWVLFRASSFAYAFDMLKVMAGAGASGTRPFGEFFNPTLAVVGVVACAMSFPLYPWLRRRLSPRPRVILGSLLFVSVFVLASAKVLAGAYSPFLYFRF